VGEVDISVQADEYIRADECIQVDESIGPDVIIRPVPGRPVAAVTHVRLTATADLPVAAFEREYVQPLL
jgi:hypothetical protein